MKSRSRRRVVCSILWAVLACGWIHTPALAHAADEGAQTHWRWELSGGAAWLPGGDAFRSAYFLGIGGNRGAFSIGTEFSRYQLSLHDDRRDETKSYGVWEWFPLVLGLNFDLDGVPLRVGASAAVGVGVGEEVTVATCTTRNYLPLVVRGRAHAQYVSGSFAVGPFAGYSHDLGGQMGEGCDIGLPGPDPQFRDYPDAVPFGIEVGLGATLRL